MNWSLNPSAALIRRSFAAGAVLLFLGAAFPCASGQIPVIRPDAQPAPPVVAADPSDLFLKAFTAVQQGQKLEADGNLRGALAKYRFGASMLTQLAQSSPSWQPLIVRYRAHKTTEDIQRLEDKLSIPPGGNIPGEPPMQAPARGGPEDDLPQADDNSGGNYYGGGQTDAQTEAIDRSSAELRTKLAKTQKDLKSALDQLAEAQKERLAALKDKNSVEDQLDAAKADAKAAEKKFQSAKSDRDDLQAQVDKAEAQYKDAAAKDPTAKASRRELFNQVTALRDALAKAKADADASAKARDDLNKKLSDSDAKTAELTKQRDAAVAQSDLTKDAAQKIQTLQTENATLTQKLSVAEASIAQLTTDSAKKKQELDGVRAELDGLKGQLAASKQQNDKSTSTISDLRAQLDQSAKNLEDLKAKGQATGDFAKVSKENELLRGIVMRQLKDQARRVAAKELLTQELSKLEVQSTELNRAVEELGRPTLQLSDEERALFKDPQVTISDTTDPSSMAIQISAVKGSRPDGAPLDPGSAPPLPAAAGSPGATVDANKPSGSSPANGANNAPRVETAFHPKVTPDLMPMAREAMEDFDRGKYGDAEQVYDKLIARDPKNPYLLSNQGVVLFRESKLKSAEVMLKKAVAAAPKDAFAQATLGIVYYSMRNYDAAVTCLTQAIQIDPKNATAHNYLGITSSQKGWPEAAIEEINKAIALNPNYADAHFNIAVIYATNQPPSKERAEEHYRIATSLGAQPDPALEKLLRN
jgi:tetratricopeptide (TPR) repeat protein